MRHLDKLISILGGFTLSISTLLILINVVNRYVVQGWLLRLTEFNILTGVYELLDPSISSISAISDEVPGLLLVWVAFLGAYLAVRDGGHISFDMFVEKMPHKIKHVLQKIVDFLIAIFLFVLLYQSGRMIMVDGSTEIETLEIGQGWFMSILVIFPILMLAALLDKAINQKKGLGL